MFQTHIKHDEVSPNISYYFVIVGEKDPKKNWDHDWLKRKPNTHPTPPTSAAAMLFPI